MTVVKECTTLEQAWLAKNQLENEGVAADILDEATASTAPYLLNSSGIRLAVADEDAAAARQVLGLPPVDETRRAGRQGVPGWLVFSIVVAAVVSLFAAGLNHRSQPVRGSHKVDEDRRHDGKIDKRVEYDAKGHMMARYLDQNGDGKWDVRDTCENGAVVLSEQDLDFDGSYDLVCQCKDGRKVSETIKPGGSGFPLFRYDYDKNGILEAKWEDPDRDGAWDTCIRYDAMGRETGRQALQAK